MVPDVVALLVDHHLNAERVSVAVESNTTVSSLILNSESRLGKDHAKSFLFQAHILLVQVKIKSIVKTQNFCYAKTRNSLAETF